MVRQKLLLYQTVDKYLTQKSNSIPNATAIDFEGKKLTYDELNSRTNKLANFLISKDIGINSRIGICLDRSFEMIICLIGILKAGAAYVPLDPDYPPGRLAIMQEDAKLSLLLCHEKFSSRFDKSNNLVFWKSIEKKIDEYSDKDPLVSINGEDVAYVIFTSGSTGRPKGISMPHRALANLIEWQLERSYFKKKANVLQYSSISFDVSFQEIATTLASGGTLYLTDDKKRRDPRILLEYLNDFQIERLFIPFVALRSLIEAAISNKNLPISLKEVITAGEQLRVDNAVRTFFDQIPGVILENQYGPSETHVISSYLLDEDPSTWSDLPPIGKPILNNCIYILDENMQPVVYGKSGELYLAGQNVARGYIGSEELTKKSFIDNPFSIGNQLLLYKTGDLGLYNEDGDIEFLGRADQQIKIRGYRIEPGEINTEGAKYRGIAQCLTHAVHDQAGKPQLVTYYVAKKGITIKKEDFKSYLIDTLPEYMVPNFIFEIEDVPYTPSGKVDFNSLPKPDKEFSFNDEEIEYKSETEVQIAKIWSDLLGFEKVPRTTSFFDLGGDSLTAVTFFLKIEEKFDQSLPLSSLTQASNIRDLAILIDGEKRNVDLSRFRSLQLIQQGSSYKIPLFLVHGGAGNVLMFKDLTKGLDSDQPIYAFQWPGWDGNRGEYDILEMAKTYKNELREAYPSGPYRLGGHCVGGIIAIELANLLKKEGAKVIDPILVTDGPNLYSKKYHSSEPESSVETHESFQKVSKRLYSLIPEEVNNEKNNKIYRSKKVTLKKSKNTFFRKFLTIAKKLPFYNFVRLHIFKLFEPVKRSSIWLKHYLGIKIPIKDRSLYSRISLRHAIKKYQEVSYDGDILYLSSVTLLGRDLGLKGWWQDPYLGFGELCSGKFDAHIVGGGHNDIYNKFLAQNIIQENMFTNKLSDK